MLEIPDINTSDYCKLSSSLFQFPPLLGSSGGTKPGSGGGGGGDDDGIEIYRIRTVMRPHHHYSGTTKFEEQTIIANRSAGKHRTTSTAPQPPTTTTTTTSNTGIEIYSVRSMVRRQKALHGTNVSSSKCEFLAPHSVEAWIDDSTSSLAKTFKEGEEDDEDYGRNALPLQVFYFQPSRCVCLHCLLADRLESSVLPSLPGRQCLS